MIYDLIIVGGGAAGLFAAANIKLNNSTSALILDKAALPGRKLLMSGSGQCNLTHSGNIREFTEHYGESGNKIRPVVFGFNNEMLQAWFEERNMPLTTRSDGKVFPASLSAESVLTLLLDEAEKNGFALHSNTAVTKIVADTDNFMPNHSLYDNSTVADTDDAQTQTDADSGSDRFLFRLETSRHGNKETLNTRRLLLACGGCSYPSTGSDGSIFDALSPLNLEIVAPRPALTAINTERYPYSSLSGISVSNAVVSIYDGTMRTKKAPVVAGDVLLTHKNFSGPAILNISRYAENGKTLEINWFPDHDYSQILSGINNMRSHGKKLLLTALNEYFESIAQAHLRLLCKRASINDDSRISTVDGESLKKLIHLITADKFTISGNGGFKSAMATAGGISLSEIKMSDMQSRRFPGLYFAGEMLDADGDTGGYNLQFAFSSAYRAALALRKSL